MMGFIEWVEFQSKRKTKEKKNVQSTDQGSSEIRHVDQQGKTAGFDPTINPTNIHYLPEPQ